MQVIILEELVADEDDVELEVGEEVEVGDRGVIGGVEDERIFEEVE